MINNEDVIWDAITPQDVIIADLKKGRYSTLSGVGSKFIWERLVNQISKDEIIATCKSQFKMFDSKDVEEIDNIIRQLLDEDILKKSDVSFCQKNAQINVPEAQFESMQVKLTQYDDMQTLLKLDPIDNILED